MANSGEGSAAVAGSDQGPAVDLQPLFKKLKPGPGLPADQVLVDQRRRLHGAALNLMDGKKSLGVRPIARAAGVSTSTFYKHFVNVDDCLASTFDSVMATTMRHASSAQRLELDWQVSLRAIVTRLMEHFARDPRAAHFALIDIFAAGPNARKRIGPKSFELEGVLSTAFAAAPRAIVPPRHLVAGMTAGMLRVARTTTLAGRADELPGLAGQVGDWMLSLPSAGVLSLRVAAGDLRSAPRRELNPFPADPPSLDPSVEATSARSRLLTAALKLAAADGPAQMTVLRLRREAGVSRRLFDSTFGGVEECFLEAVEATAGKAAAGARDWCDGSAEWKQSTCRFTLALCAQAARNRTWARLIFLGVFAAGRTGLLRRERMIGTVTKELRSTLPADQTPPSVIAEASVAAAWHIAQSDIAARRARALPMVAPLLSYILLAPIVGPDQACADIQASFGRHVVVYK